MSAQWDVFISYSHADAASIQPIVSDIAAAGLRVWQDKSEARPPDRTREAINRGIGDSASFLIFVSRRSLKSKWVLNELDAAMIREIASGKKYVLPVLLGRVLPKQLPPDLQGKVFYDLRRNFRERYAVVRQVLIEAIRAMAGRTTSRPTDGIPVGPGLLKYFLEFEYDLRREPPHLDRRAVELFCEGILAAMLAEKEFRRETRWFTTTYGKRAAVKVLAKTLSEMRVSLGGGFGDSVWDNLPPRAGTVFVMFSAADELEGSGLRIMARPTERGLTLWMEQVDSAISAGRARTASHSPQNE